MAVRHTRSASRPRKKNEIVGLVHLFPAGRLQDRPGNKQFADQSNQVLDHLCHRIRSSHDIVPYAFVSALLRTFSSQYDNLESDLESRAGWSSEIWSRTGSAVSSTNNSAAKRHVCKV